ncbi:MAG: hypothetical protein ACOCWA_08380, partial [Bacteroidota bacterium]
ESNFRHVPEGLEVHRIPIIEPFSAFKKVSGRKPDDSPNPVYVRSKKRSWIDELAIWIRGNLFIPDARALWVRPATRRISDYIRKQGNIHALFSDGPPHTNTRIAYHVARKTAIPWIADFQDPWTQVDYYKLLKITSFADNIHKKMEQDVFRQADKITIASPSWAKDLEMIGARNVSVLYYGYDEDDFSGDELSSPGKPELASLKKRFVINHAGLLGMDRFPGKFLEVLAELGEEQESFKKDILIYFPGEVDYSIKNYIKDLGLENNTLYPGHISKQLAVTSMRLANILLLPLNKAENVKGRLPGKLYEYLRSYTPILALGPEDSDVNVILKQTGTGKCLDYENKAEIRKYISGIYDSFKKGVKAEDFLKDEIRQFDVKNQTRKLADYLNEVSNGKK